MSKPDLEPLDPELRRLLDIERARTGAPAATKARSYGRLASAVAVGTIATTATTSSSAAGVAKAAASAGGTVTAKLVGVAATTKVVIALLVGAAVGSAATAAFVAPGRRPVAVAASPTHVAAPSTPSAPPSTAPSESATVNLYPSAIPVVHPSAIPNAHSSGSTRAKSRPAEVVAAPPTDVASAASAPPVDRSLSDERRILDRARQALARKDAEGAMVAAREHESAFPRGQMSAEREAIVVQGLAMANRREEAIERASRFRSTYPNSVLTPVVDSAVGESK